MSSLCSNSPGLNQKITPVSSAKLHRWIHIIDPQSEDFDLRPVTLERAGVFSYIATPSGPTISSESTSPLSPGDYGWFHGMVTQLGLCHLIRLFSRLLDDCHGPDDYRGLPFVEVHPPVSFEVFKDGAPCDRLKLVFMSINFV